METCHFISPKLNAARANPENVWNKWITVGVWLNKNDRYTTAKGYPAEYTRRNRKIC